MTRVKKRVIAAFREGTEDNPYSGSVAEFSPFTNDEIRDAIMEADAFICGRIIDTPQHPYRPQFISASPTTLTSGSLLTAAVGPHDRVMVSVGGVYVDGVQLKNRSRFDSISAYPDADTETVYQKYYFIEHGRIYSKSANIRVYFPEFTPDEATFVLQSPVRYERGVIANAIVGLDNGKHTEIINRWSRLDEIYMREISDGKRNLSDVELLRKTEGAK